MGFAAYFPRGGRKAAAAASGPGEDGAGGLVVLDHNLGFEHLAHVIALPPVGSCPFRAFLPESFRRARVCGIVTAGFRMLFWTLLLRARLCLSRRKTLGGGGHRSALQATGRKCRLVKQEALLGQTASWITLVKEKETDSRFLLM